jgi:hypothetical protein
VEAREPRFEVNGQPSVLALDAGGGPIGMLSLEIAGGTVHAIRSVVNPEKPAHISSTILPSLPPDLKRS